MSADCDDDPALSHPRGDADGCRRHRRGPRRDLAGVLRRDPARRLPCRPVGGPQAGRLARQKRTSTLVAELPGHRILGFGDCGPSRHRELPYPAEVYTLYVLPDWQDQGIGRRLLIALFDEIAAKGAHSAFLWVLSRNPTRFFYEAMGGAPVAERQERFAGALLDETAYAWSDLPAWLVEARR